MSALVFLAFLAEFFWHELLTSIALVAWARKGFDAIIPVKDALGEGHWLSGEVVIPVLALIGSALVGLRLVHKLHSGYKKMK